MFTGDKQSSLFCCSIKKEGGREKEKEKERERECVCVREREM